MLNITTKELDPITFQTGIWFSQANLLSPIIIEAERAATFQTLQDALGGESKRLPQIFANYAVTAGIGQYTAENDNTAGLLARFDISFRHPVAEEMETDWENFGEQVIAGPKWDELEEEKRKVHTFFRLGGEEFVFTGPPRVYKGIFTTRVFPGQAPESIAELAQEVDELAEKCKETLASEAIVVPELIVKQNYFVFLADKGRISQLAFGELEGYDLSQARDFGLVEVSNGSLLFHPGGDREQTKDFSNAMYGEDLFSERDFARSREEPSPEETPSLESTVTEEKVPAEPRTLEEGTMRHLFIVRHGHYDDDTHRLNPYGKEQMEKVGAAIREIVGDSAYILSSTAPRSIDSAEVLAVQLGLPTDFETTQELWTAKDSPKKIKYHCDSDLLLGMVDERRDKADGLILVSHLDICQDLPGAFYQKEFGEYKSFKEIETGEACHINIQTQDHRIIR